MGSDFSYPTREAITLIHAKHHLETSLFCKQKGWNNSHLLNNKYNEKITRFWLAESSAVQV